jgi:hypothetical protein
MSTKHVIWLMLSVWTILCVVLGFAPISYGWGLGVLLPFYGVIYLISRRMK